MAYFTHKRYETNTDSLCCKKMVQGNILDVSFMFQDEDADFMAKLAKLMSAAGTQLLNSYSKYEIIF